ncbi:MAG: MFS transporter [Eubacteriaceae bacterium]|jgi:GPH family glycoside/pentoside/hexuronide:cation symporter|nr:MFS transporter [Eubacteriaceae bacterium]
MENERVVTNSEVNRYALYGFFQNIAIMVPFIYGQFFMTDILDIGIAKVTTALLVGRIFDFIVSVLAGGIIESSHLKWGKYRSWFVIGRWTLFFGIIFQLTNAMTLPTNAQLVICAIGYMMMHGTMNFVATANMGVLSLIAGPDMEGRFRMTVATSRYGAVAGIITGAAILPVIGLFERFLSPANAYMAVAVLFGCLVLIGAQIIIRLSEPYDKREMWDAAEGTPRERVRVSDMFAAVAGNDQLLIYMGATTLTNIGMAIFGAFTMYFYRLILGNLNFYTIASTATTIFGLVAAMVMPRLGARLGKRRSLPVSQMWVAVGYIINAVVLSTVWRTPMTALISYIVIACAVMCGTYLAMGYGANYVIDCGEYGFWKTGKDYRAVVMSMMNIPMKIGMVIGGAIGGYILANIGYSGAMSPGDVTAAFARTFLYSWFGYPAACNIIASLMLTFAYKLTDDNTAKYAAENAARIRA